jgi:glycerol-3-phosphate dehydrogenase (NAD(P)+)
MAHYEKIAVIGSGSWGTAVANIFADQGYSTTVWGRDAEVVAQIQHHHENRKYLKGISLSEKLAASSDLAATLKAADVIVCSIPTQQIRSVFGTHRDLVQGKLVVNTSKGIEMGTHLLVSQIFKEITPDSPYVMLSGPSFASEVARRLPAACAAAASDLARANQLQHMLSNNYFRIYSSTDVVGVEVAGALKNVVAIASGMVNGLKLGYNAQAAIINRGIAEMMRLGNVMGAQSLTFLGLSGMGDLILTCTGPLSRNRKLGEALGEGKKVADIQRELGGVAEGVYTARSAHELSLRLKIEMPITEQIYRIVYENGTPQQAVTELMSRDLKQEW